MKSLSRILPYSDNRDRPVKESILNPAISDPGYYQVSLSLGHGKTKRIRVHQIVAAAFLGPKSKGCVINHIDGDYLNNDYRNLEYVTQAENIDHARRGGKMAKKLTPEQVHDIRYLREKEGLTYKEIGGRFGVSGTMASYVCRYKFWKD